MADLNQNGGDAGTTTNTRRRNTRKPAAARGRQTTTASRRGTAKAAKNAIPQAAAGTDAIAGHTSVQAVMLGNVGSYASGIAPSLKSLGLTRAQVMSEFQKALGPNW